MLAAIGSTLRKPLEYVGIISQPAWVLTEEEEELAKLVEEMFTKKPVVYQERQGHVTQLSNDSIELNHRWIYQLPDSSIFSVGDYVSWKEYKTGTDVVIKDVVRVEDMGEFEQRQIYGAKITKVDKPKYETNIGVIFYLDKVICDLEFRPELSDFVNFECSYPKNDDGADEFAPDPNFLVVKRVSPGNSKLVTGKITAWDPVTLTGVVNNQVIFHQNVCDQLHPRVGTSVACNCVKGEYAGDCSWRAYNMTENKIVTSSNDRHFFIVDRFPDFEVVLGETKIVELHVSNSSNRPVLVESVSAFDRDQKIETPEKLKLPYQLLPETTVSWPVEVKGSKLGRQKIKLQWYLAKKKFPITTNIFYSTVQQNLGEANSSRVRRRAPVVVPGQRRIRNPVFRRVPIREYAVPEKLREICTTYSAVDLTELQIALQHEKPVMAEGLCIQNYGDYMHTLLFIEEIAEEKGFEKLATRASLYRTKECVTFNFPADSEYSKVVCGDSVWASKPWESVKYEAKVWTVSSIQLGLKFNAEFENTLTSGALYDLEFKMNRGPNRRRHQAVDLVLKNLGAEWLFPNEHQPANKSEIHIENWCNKDLNSEQKSAVKNILAKKNLPYPYIIYGPPGTGKTVTVVETILQIISHQKDYCILVTAPTNSAVDTLGLRLLEFGIFDKSEMVRLSGYNSYSSGSIAVQLMDISMVPCLGDPAHDAPLMRDSTPTPTMYLDDIGQHKITLGTLATISYLNSVGVSKGYFTHIIIDEAGQCHEPETLLPIALFDPDKTQLVLAGDPQQLGPVTSSVLAKQYSYDQSFLDRLTKCYLYRKRADTLSATHGYNPVLITRLVLNYRSLPKIVDLVGSIFYGGDLRSAISEVDSREARVLSSIMIHREALKDCMDSMVFINVNTPEEQVEGSFSWFNQGEIAQVFLVLNFLYNAKVSPDDIGVITPYSLQVKKIYEYLDTLGAISPKVASVEEFQGQERDVIILSLVRNNLGMYKRLSSFITDQHRVNVALSRARVLNVIIGNRSTLLKDPLWGMIIAKCRVINLAPTPIEDTVD